jgi:enoyl-CoA hydratase/carnithine racemase
MARDLARACARIGDDHAVRAVVLSSASPTAFCVGADLKERGGFTDADFLHQRLVFRAAFGSVLALACPPSPPCTVTRSAAGSSSPCPAT